MRRVDFQRFMNSENIIRVRFEIDRGHVLKFMAQLECLLNNYWTPVIRYDTAHGFAHCDRLHPYEQALKTTMGTQDYNEALTFAINDLSENWENYRGRYERWLRRN